MIRPARRHPAAPAKAVGRCSAITWLMTQSPRHKAIPLGDLEWLVMPAILLQQFRIFDNGEQPVGVVVWARADDIVAKRIDAGDVRLTPAEWKSGANRRIVDVVAPFGGRGNAKGDQQLAGVMMNIPAVVRFLRALSVVLVILVTWNASAEAQQLSLRIKEASLTTTIDNHQALKIHLSEQSKAEYAEFTARYIGRRIVFSAQGRPLMSARLMTSVLSGEVQVLIDQESAADELVVGLATGKIAIDVRVLGE